MQTEAQRHASTAKARDTLPANKMFLRMPGVLARVPVGRSTLWGWVRAGTFPAPVKLGPMVTAWRASDVQAWADSQGVAK